MAAVDALFRDTSVTQQALRSFDDYTTKQIPRIINTTIKVCSQLENDDRTHTIRIHSPIWGEPSIVERDGMTVPTDSEKAKLRDLTYSTPLYGQINYDLIKTSDGSKVFERKYENVFLGRIPIMVKSSLDTPSATGKTTQCSKDCGGYFIVNGREKVVIIQESIKPNTVMVFQSKSRGVESVIYPRLDDLTLTNATCKAYLKRDQIFFDINGQRPFELPVLMKKVPLAVLVAVVGRTYDELIQNVTWGITDEVKKMRVLSFIDPSFDTPLLYRAGVATVDSDVTKERKAANTIHRCWYNYAIRSPKINARLTMLRYAKRWETMIYPHDPENSGEILFEQIRMLVYTTLKFREADSRDSEKNKRLNAAGTLMMQLTAQLWNQWTTQLTKTIQKYVNSKKQMRFNKLGSNTILTEGLKFSLATGVWRSKSDVGGKTGVAQGLNRQTYVSGISQLRRADSSVPSDSKVVNPRLLRGDEWAFRCPSATPEGAPNGLVTQLSVAARISVESDPKDIHKQLRRFKHKTGKYPIYVNGCFFGRTRSPARAAKHLRKQRRSRILPIDVSISVTDNKLQCFCDSGRTVRPVFIVHSIDECGTTEEIDTDLRSGRMTWEDLLSAGIVEYIDSQETENCLIALQKCEITPYHTHCEIHPCLILSVLANCIPFPEHNQSPRIVYQCAMGKQSIGIMSENYQTRFDTVSNVLHYPQKPLVSTAVYENVAGELPSGCNAIVAILCYGGYNQEDSILINQGSLDRGFGRITSYRTHSASDVARGQKKHVFCNENPANTAVESDGLPRRNAYVEKGEVLIGRKVGSRDASIKNKKNAGNVDDILIFQNDQGGQTVKVKMRQTRVPQLGDKYSSRHGQKGTIGLIIPEESMPYTRDGIRPDIIISPHALPSRMTVAHVLECLASKVASLNGVRQMATAFEHAGVYDYMEQLHELGFEKRGDEVMYDGRTGERLEGKVFLGPTYYQRLKHMVEDKIYSRGNEGHLNQLTRQPAQGRSRSGGLRWGEMERDVGLAYGASYVLQDRMMKSSDVYSAPVCRSCGLVGTHVKRAGRDICCACEGEIGLCEMPYAAKTLLEELTAMGVAPRLDVK